MASNTVLATRSTTSYREVALGGDAPATAFPVAYDKRGSFLFDRTASKLYVLAGATPTWTILN